MSRICSNIRTWFQVLLAKLGFTVPAHAPTSTSHHSTSEPDAWRESQVRVSSRENLYLYASGLEAKLRAAMVAQVSKDLGVREHGGNNRGPRVDAINRRAHLPMGSPYCAAGASEAWDDVCHQFGLKNPLGVQGGSQVVIGLTPAKFRKVSSAKAGDLVGFTDRANASHGHIGTVRENMAAHTKSFKTIEYNTNGDGSRDGDGVYDKDRSTDGSRALRFRYFLDVVSWTLEHNGIKG